MPSKQKETPKRSVTVKASSEAEARRAGLRELRGSGDYRGCKAKRIGKGKYRVTVV